ncbi:MAG TPA: transporter substrate-binding domain-containing protein [Azospirillaceae bacterium]|nr:transporter substrate-binding domain-containing protein [Azospirillaceae bacterium]
MVMRKLAAAAVMVLGFFGAGTASAQTSYVVGVENIEYFPHYTYADGDYKGFARDLLDAFAKDKGYAFQYRALPVSRLMQEFVGQEIDLKYPDNSYWSADQRKGKDIVYSDPVVAYIDGVSVKPENVGKGPDAVAKLGIVRGFTAWDWMDRISGGKVTLAENNSFSSLVQTSIAGRVDGAYGNVAVVKHQLEKQLKQPGALAYDPGLPHTESNYHLSTIKHPKLIEEFNAWLKANADLMAKLKAEYGV